MTLQPHLDFTQDPTAGRHGGNPESVAAFALVDGATDRRRVMEAVRAAGERGMCSHEIKDALGKAGLNEVSGRLSELKQARLLVDTGRRCECGGARAAVLVARAQE